MKKSEMRELVSSMSMKDIEKLLFVLEVEMRERSEEELPVSVRELELMECYSDLPQ
jgi:hypothetical protein